MKKRRLCLVGMIFSLSRLDTASCNERIFCFVPARHPSEREAYNRKEEERIRSRLSAALESPIEDERRPLRRPPLSTASIASFVNDWTVERYNDPEPVFPDTVDKLAEAAYQAIAGTIYNKECLDPNIASNAMAQSIYHYRPVRKSNEGRIGVELDGTKFLFSGADSRSSASAIRHVALLLASKLSRGHWDGLEDEADDNSADFPRRPIAVYFNTIKQALVASKELRLLKQEALSGDHDVHAFDDIYIFALGQDNKFPKRMRLPKRPFRGPSSQKINGKRGLLLVVQPTDYNSEFRPPGPAVGTVEHLQRLVARASVEGFPTVVLSPRFLAHAHYNHQHGGWDQSGYQQSATYGGDEPPRGPTPWIMRDFTPPVFSWLGCALFSREHRDHQQQRVTMTQSVTQEDHAWHIFAADDSSTAGSTAYRYLASTKTSSGRPPRDIVRHIFNEWS